MKHLGDFDASTVVYGKFTTFRPSTGAAFTLGGTPALSVYKDNSTTQSTTGVTLTVDFDTVTGLNHFAIDTSADGTFYSAGSFFDIVITTGSVDSVSVVGSVVASFTIRKNSALKPATAGRTLVVDAAGLADANAVKVGPSGSGTAQTARDIGASVLLSAGTGTGQLDFTSGVVKANVTQFGGSAGSFASGIPAVNASQFGGATVTATTSVTIPAASTLATTTGAVGSVTGAVGSVTGAVGSVTGNVGGNVSGSVGSVVGAVGSVTGNVGGNVVGSVGSVVADVTADVVKIDGVADAADRLQKVVQGNVFGTVGVGSTTTSIVTSALDPAAAVNDQYKGRILTFKNDTTTANLRGQSTDITASTSLGVLTVTALTTSPASGDTFTIS